MNPPFQVPHVQFCSGPLQARGEVAQVALDSIALDVQIVRLRGGEHLVAMKDVVVLPLYCLGQLF